MVEYDRFKKATKWIEDEYKRLGWTHSYRTFNPEFESDIKEFELLVLNPLEEAWSKLSDEEKRRFEI